LHVLLGDDAQELHIVFLLVHVVAAVPHHLLHQDGKTESEVVDVLARLGSGREGRRRQGAGGRERGWREENPRL